jgi:hypothetical protein
MTPATRRNIYFPDDLWQRITRAAGRKQAEKGESYSLSDWIRDACEKELKRQERKT